MTPPAPDKTLIPDTEDDGFAVARKCIQCGVVFYADLSTAATGMCGPCAEAAGLRRPTQPLPELSDSDSGAAFDAEHPGGRDVADAGGPADSELEVLRRGLASQFREDDRSAARRRLAAYAAVALAVLVAIAFAIGRCSGPDLPSSPASRQARWLVEVMNDSALVDSAVIEERFAPVAIASASLGRIKDEIVRWDERSDDYAIARVVEGDDPHLIELLITNEAMEWGRITVQTETERPYRIVRFTIEPIDPPAGGR